MITEQELKGRCTPEFIKWMCEMAEGFEWKQLDRTYFQTYFNGNQIMGLHYFSNYFPLLIHRAVEGWNNNESTPFIIEVFSHMVRYNEKLFRVKNYQPKSLTHAECAMLDCLLDVFKTEGER